MKILIITDAYEQVNGVVNTINNIKKELEKKYEVCILSHKNFKTTKLPFYKEIKVAINPWKIKKEIEKENPDFIHIATEGPVGLFGKMYCDKRKIPYSTSYHTMFPEYLDKTLCIPKNLSYKYFRWFHKKSKSVLVTTKSMIELLSSKKFNNLVEWTRGVDLELFNPNYENILNGLERPIYINVGRVSKEKNLEALLNAQELPGTILIIGDGPMLEKYKKDYPLAVYAGYKHGKELAQYLASSDYFVFPSKTDTFGLVNIEALACGLPVIAYDVQGPKDIITNNKDGILAKDDIDFYLAFSRIKNINKEECIAKSKKYTWEACAEIFEKNLQYIKNN